MVQKACETKKVLSVPMENCPLYLWSITIAVMSYCLETQITQEQNILLTMGQEGLIPLLIRYMAMLFLSKTNVVEYIQFTVRKGHSKI